MIQKLRLKNFKNFRDAELVLGPFSLLIGTNASGKSNLRDAFRFLQGIARGYPLAEILGERYAEGGALQWSGIRGGAREVAFSGSKTFTLEVFFSTTFHQKKDQFRYLVEVQPVGADGEPHLILEALYQNEKVIFNVFRETEGTGGLWVRFGTTKRGGKTVETLPLIDDSKAFLSTATTIFGWNRGVFGIEIKDQNLEKVRERALKTSITLTMMRFFEFEPQFMRVPSAPGQDVLGDRGENLSTALMTICKDVDKKLALLEWIKALTPMDAVDLEFPLYADGKTLVHLVESNGRRISANSASDGTLRFLAVLTALLSPKRDRFNFFEELENGIHPTRLKLLLEAIEQQAKQNELQIVATTHSPQLLRLVQQEHFIQASVIYSPEEQTEAHIKQIAQFPESIRTVLQDQDAARLLESGWFENTLSFMNDDDAVGDQE